MSRSLRARFRRFIAKHNGRVLDPANVYEFVRFKASGQICVVYQNGYGTITMFHGKQCFQAWRAFKNKWHVDLSVLPFEHPRNTWRDRARALSEIIDVRTGNTPAIAVRPFSRAHNLTARFLVCFALKHGLTFNGRQLVRGAA